MTPDRATLAIDPRPAAARRWALALLASLALLPTATAQATTRYVDAGDPDCDDVSGDPFCSVQWAVWESESRGGDVVEIAAGTYVESVDFDRSVTLRGAGGSSLAGACAGETMLVGIPAVHVDVGATVTISDMTLAGIADEGGAVFNEGTLTLSHAEVCRSSAFQRGSGIYTTGALELVDAQVYDNEQANWGTEGGGLYVAAGGSAAITRSSLTGNRATRGGAIAVAAGGTLLISRGELYSNFADDSTPSATPGWGGGIYNAGVAVIDQSSVGSSSVGNVALYGGYGGGIYNAGGLLVTRSALTTNAVAGTTGTVGFGAGLYNAGVASLVSTTVSQNAFDPQMLGYGAGIASVGTLSLSNVTVTANANGGAGILLGAGVYVGGGTATLRNSIVVEQAVGQDCYGAVTTDGHNLDSDGSCNLVSVAAGGTDQPLVADPGLLPLSDNGGPTRTHGLTADSPAMDAGDPAGCLADFDADGVAATALTADQRGTLFAEVVNVGVGTGPCDSGAVEYDLVANGMMEDDDDGNRLPDGWTGTNLLAGDRLLCEPALAHAGRCSFRMVGRPNLVKQLSQASTLGGAAGDLYTLRVFAAGVNVTGRPRVRVQLDDLQGVGIEQEVVLPIPTGTFPYVERTLEIASSVNGYDRITVIVEAGTAGALALDDVSLVPHP